MRFFDGCALVDREVAAVDCEDAEFDAEDAGLRDVVAQPLSTTAVASAVTKGARSVIPGSEREELVDIAERLELHRVPGRVEEEHRPLFPRLTFEPEVWLDDELGACVA